MGQQEFLKANLSDIVVEYLKRKILRGEYKEGDRINEVKVAGELNISRAPVREGIKVLESHGLVKPVPRRGNFVTKMTMKDIKEIYDIRLMLEDSIIEILINEKRLDEKDFREITGIIDDMMLIAESSEELEEKIFKINEKDMEFHKYLWEKADSPRRMKILSDLHMQLQFAMLIDARMTGDPENTAKTHYEIVKCLKGGDVSGCKKALRDHIEMFHWGLSS